MKRRRGNDPGTALLAGLGILHLVELPDTYHVTLTRTTDGLLDLVAGVNWRWEVTTDRGKWIGMGYCRTERGAEKAARRAATRNRTRPPARHANAPRTYSINF